MTTSSSPPGPAPAARTLALVALRAPGSAASGSAMPEPAAEPSRRLRVALVNMPWARIDAPSIQCGLLQAIARRAGHDCDTHYLNVEFASLVGATVYDKVANVASERLHMLGEWLFSYAAFGEVTSERDYCDEYPEAVSLWTELTGEGFDHLVHTRRETLPAWIDECAARANWAHYDVVGFSSTFLQNTASLALGRALKVAHPHVALVYGGANFDAEMGDEYAAVLPWLDYVVAGEADVTFPALLRTIADGREELPAGVCGYGRERDIAAPDGRRPSILDESPPPDYHDYFQWLDRFGRAELLGRTPVKLPVEFSRGCWWGQKHHCTFCGLNALGMTFRSKSSSRALSELADLLQEYPSVHIDAVDNILEMGYLSSFCAELAERRWDISIFFEVKANLTREQLGTLARAGVTRIQPGIESLSTHVLELMRKGSTKLINIRLLKWARYYGVRVSWNVLAGFPGEKEDDYREQLELLPLLHHLEPPAGCGRIWLERFSPYFTDDAFPIHNIRPRGSYRHIYPATIDASKIAYFFDYEVSDTCSDEVIAEMNAAIKTWRTRYDTSRPSLIYQRVPGRMTIIDRRTDEARQLVLDGWRAEAYDATGDAPRTAARVHQKLAEQGFTVSVQAVTALLQRCCRLGVMVCDDGRYLSLALPENPGW